MATLLLGDAESRAAGTPIRQPHLRQWLADSWALIFSHPGDFVRCELEMDRWLSVMQHTFVSCRIKPLELPAAPGAAPSGSWVGEAGGDARSVALLDPQETRLTVRDLRAHALQEEITALGRRRFVMIVDDALRSRRTFAYSALAEIPSPLEFAGWAAAARARDRGASAVTRHRAAI
jgi:hypothetical protein